MYCHKCGSPNDDQAVFCDKCGASLQKPSQVRVIPSPAGTAAVTYAGFWRRLLAWLIDGAILTVVWLAIYYTLIGIGVISVPEIIDEAEVEAYTGWLIRYMLVSNLVMIVLQTLYFSLMESSSKQATLGKMVLGVRVTDLDGRRIPLGRAIGRNLGKIVSAAVFLIGYFMIAFTKKKQGLHDIMADCLVVVKE